MERSVLSPQALETRGSVLVTAPRMEDGAEAGEKGSAVTSTSVTHLSPLKGEVVWMGSLGFVLCLNCGGNILIMMLHDFIFERM